MPTYLLVDFTTQFDPDLNGWKPFGLEDFFGLEKTVLLPLTSAWEPGSLPNLSPSSISFVVLWEPS